MASINREELEKVAADLEAGNQLTFAHLGKIFGDEFWYMIVECLMDANDAARAIQGAIARLSGRMPIAEYQSAEHERHELTKDDRGE